MVAPLALLGTGATGGVAAGIMGTLAKIGAALVATPLKAVMTGFVAGKIL